MPAEQGLSAPPSTLNGTLVAGPVVAAGNEAAYRQVAIGPPEERLVRLDLLNDETVRGPGTAKPRQRSLLHLAHVTDLQLADAQSPGRFEFLEYLRGTPASGAFAPAYRPQEALVAHAFDSMLQSIENARSTETGTPVELVISTGDNIDNSQWNELSWYLTMLTGGQVDLGNGRPYSGVQAIGWPGNLCWRPDGGSDRWRGRYGFPTVPGLLSAALAPFVTEGLSLPWLSCFGNHDGLPFGELVPTSEYCSQVLSSHKAHSLPARFDPRDHLEELYEHPELFASGPARRVPADEDRRIIGRREFIESHMNAPGSPSGHGFSAANLKSGTTYFTHDPTPGVRVIVLDTANLDGWHEGSIGMRQFSWLEERLAECHSSYLGEDGRMVAGGGEDRLVVIASHHGLSKMSNLRQSERGLEEDHPRLGAAAIEQLFARFPNVVVWLNGHRHLNEIASHRSLARGAAGSFAGYFEIATASVADWPSQGRLVELVANSDGTLSILTTMLNHRAPVTTELDGSAESANRLQLASLHRELAANVPAAGFGSLLEGRREDRNCELVLPAPFEI